MAIRKVSAPTNRPTNIIRRQIPVRLAVLEQFFAFLESLEIRKIAGPVCVIGLPVCERIRADIVCAAIPIPAFKKSRNQTLSLSFVFLALLEFFDSL